MFSVDGSLPVRAGNKPAMETLAGDPTHPQPFLYFSTMHYFNCKFLLILKALLFAKSESECIFWMTSRNTKDETKQKFSFENNDIKDF